jgi:hypothetical protein
MASAVSSMSSERDEVTLQGHLHFRCDDGLVHRLRSHFARMPTLEARQAQSARNDQR